MRSFTSLHVRTQDPDAVRALARELRTPGLALYVAPDPPWYSLYDEGLEADEVPERLWAALEAASRLGRAALFAVYEDEGLCWGLAEEGRIRYRFCEGVEAAPSGASGRLPDDLDAAAVAAAQAGEPKTAAVRALAGMLGIFPDHAVIGFGDVLELDEEGGLPEDVWVIEDDAAPALEEDHAGG
ncbi:hypothetical protein [Oceanithermus sp.]|uniref:hypothetical protein n=1 Tax=Oceanithermus sp. TaxID=2268145 RepID=UPI00257FB3B7|nr:hypothetical protein [Oceanithermus sp.]